MFINMSCLSKVMYTSISTSILLHNIIIIIYIYIRMHTLTWKQKQHIEITSRDMVSSPPLSTDVIVMFLLDGINPGRHDPISTLEPSLTHDHMYMYATICLCLKIIHVGTSTASVGTKRAQHQGCEHPNERIQFIFWLFSLNILTSTHNHNCHWWHHFQILQTHQTTVMTSRAMAYPIHNQQSVLRLPP